MCQERPWTRFPASSAERSQSNGQRPPGPIISSRPRAAAPEARLLVLLRDPVERFRSGRTLAENRFTVGSTARAAANAAFNRGLYADQLLRLWRVFPREQVLVLQYELCVADAPGQLARTFDFLGLGAELKLLKLRIVPEFMANMEAREDTTEKRGDYHISVGVYYAP